MYYVAILQASADPLQPILFMDIMIAIIILAHIFSDFNDLYFFRYRDFGFSFVYNDKTAPSENRRSG